MMQRLLHEQVYLDTNIFIAAVEAFNLVALELLRMAERGMIFILSSEVTRGELLIKPMMGGDAALITRYDALFDDANRLTSLPVDRDIMRAAARLSATAGLELLDAVHCASAQVAGCAYIISEDRDMRSYSEIDVLSLDELELLT